MTKHPNKVSSKHGGVQPGDPYVLHKNKVASIYRAAKAWGAKHPSPFSFNRRKPR